MNSTEYRRYDAVGLAGLIRAGEVSADEVLQAALARLDEVNPKLNLLAQDYRERAAAWRPPQSGAPLAGVPFLLKDLLADWQGTPTWAGSRMMRGHVAECNSRLTDAYERAGLRIFGKTTTPEWGNLPVTESALYGDTRNPWHTDYTPGGSSGGAAAAIAAGVVPAAHGGDGGGSIRLPAHNCGVFGLMPSRGRLSAQPRLSEAWQGMVREHALTRSVRDSALLLDIAAQTQSEALYACPAAPSFSDSLKQPLRRLKIAYCLEPFFGGGIEAPIRRAAEHSLKLLADAGHEIIEAKPAFAPPETLIRAMLTILAGETAKLLEHFPNTTWRDVEAVTWMQMMAGKHISAARAYWARDIMLAQAAATAAFFRDYDVLLTPVCPRTTPKIGELLPPAGVLKAAEWLFGRLHLGRLAGLLQNNPLLAKEQAQAVRYVGFTAPFNMSGNPAMSVPLYRHNGLPVGTQFAAAHGNETLLLQLAAELERIQPWANNMPDM